MKNNPMLGKNCEEWHCLTLFQISLMSGLKGDGWILIPVSVFSLLGDIMIQSIVLS